MPEQPPTNSPSPAEVQASLHELAQVLRTAKHLEPEAQAALADLVDELSQTLASGTNPSAETAHLVQSAASVARGLTQKHNPTVLAGALERLQEATLRAEAEMPLAAGIARRLIDTLANLGI
jgi:hypothetical protein